MFLELQQMGNLQHPWIVTLEVPEVVVTAKPFVKFVNVNDEDPIDNAFTLDLETGEVDSLTCPKCLKLPKDYKSIIVRELPAFIEADRIARLVPHLKLAKTLKASLSNPYPAVAFY
jgi:hypothetical protein